MLRSLILFAIWALLSVPAAIVLIPWTILSRDGKALYFGGVWIANFGLHCVGIRVVVEQRAPLPDGACLFFSNHISNLDPPLLAGILRPRRAAMLAKQEILRLPLLGWGLRLTGFVPVARSGSLEAAKESITQARRVVASGISVAVFVEGTRSTDGALLPFKKGPFFLAMETGAPVVPVTILNAGKLLPKRSLRLRKGEVRIVLHAPIDPQQYPNREALRDATRSVIATALPS